MQTLNYKLIVSDYDGTLVNKDGTISEENKAAIKKFIEAGGIFAISTGRMPASILPQAKALGLEGLICCSQGAIILDIKTEELIFNERLSLEATLTACRKMEEMGLHIHGFDLWEYYSNMDDEMLKYYEKVARAKAIVVTDKRLSDFLEERGQPLYRLLAMVMPEDNAKTVAALEAAELPDCSITKSMDFLVEIVNPQYSKGTAVAFLAEHYGIPIDKTIAVGDNYNDISMIERAGLGIAVKNAEQPLKDAAGYVCEHTHEESAIAEIINKFGFSDN